MLKIFYNIVLYKKLTAIVINILLNQKKNKSILKKCKKIFFGLGLHIQQTEVTYLSADYTLNKIKFLVSVLHLLTKSQKFDFTHQDQNIMRITDLPDIVVINIIIITQGIWQSKNRNIINENSQEQSCFLPGLY